jgi:hypothetical protein
MKKLLIIIIILAVLAALIWAGKKYLLSGRSTFQSIYMVPPDAVLIVETNAAFDAWDKIIHSNAWNKISNIESFAELNDDIRYVDSLLSNKKVLLKAIGQRQVLVSIHPYPNGRYDYLYVLNVGRVARIQNPENLLASLLGKNFRVTTRSYNEHSILELLDTKSGELYIFSFTNDKIILSENYKLVEASLDEMDKMTLGRDLAFIDVSKRISGRGLFNVYINYGKLPVWLKTTLGKTTAGIESLKDELTYSAFSFDITPQGMITLEGYTGVNDTVASFYNSVLNAGKGSLESSQILPARFASIVKISFNNAGEYYKQSLANFSPAELKMYTSTLSRFERKLKISLEENFLGWIDDEIVLVQTEPSNLGRANEFAAVIKGKNSGDPKKNMDYIERQIQKNMPVKIRQVEYSGHSIRYIAFPGLLKALFGNMLDKIEKPYYTYIDKYVIFSNHPQTLKNMIDDYKEGNTLENSNDYYNFTDQFDNKNSAWAYFDIPVLFGNLKEFTSAENWQKLNRNKPYITSFVRAGVQIDGKDDLLHVLLKAEYREAIEEYDMPRFDTDAFLKLFTENGAAETETDVNAGWDDPVIVINDLDDSKVEVFYEDHSPESETSVKNGLKHGNYKAYYPNGQVKVRGRYRNDLRDGSWKLYDETGNIIEEKLFSEGKEVSE